MHIETTPEYLASQGLSPTFPERFWAKVNKNGPIPEHMPHLGQCWNWTASTTRDGYGQIGKGAFGKGMMPTHRAAWFLKHGAIPKGVWILHKCDNKICVRDEHLFCGNAQINHQDMDSKGRRGSARGEQSGNHKLTPEIVLQIRSIYKPFDFGYRKTAEMFGVSKGCIQRLMEGRSWTHI